MTRYNLHRWCVRVHLERVYCHGTLPESLSITSKMVSPICTTHQMWYRYNNYLYCVYSFHPILLTNVACFPTLLRSCRVASTTLPYTGILNTCSLATTST